MPEFRLEVVVTADTLEEAQRRLALVQAAVWAVEDARRENPPEDIQEGLEALDLDLEALERRIGWRPGWSRDDL